MEILRFKLWNDHDADALTADENGDYVSYATHRAMLEKMEERAIAAESKIIDLEEQNPQDCPKIISEILNGWIAEDLRKHASNMYGEISIEPRRAILAILSNLKKLSDNWHAPNADKENTTKIIEAVVNIGVDSGYGPYELDQDSLT